MAKFFFTSGRARKGIKRIPNDDVHPIRPVYSESGGSGYGTSVQANGSGGLLRPQNDGASAYPQPNYAPAGTGGDAAGYGNGYLNANANEGNNGGYANGGGYASGSFEDYYSRLIAALHSYGIEMALPTLDELYNQLASFLRPSVDAAIAGRQRYGETVMAELDADAYSRGMGASSYLSSMKNREYDDIANDIASMEANYNKTLAEYLYNASNELASIQAQFAAMKKQHEYEMERLRRQQEFERAMRAAANSLGKGSSGKGSGSSGSSTGAGTGGGAQATGSGSDANYYNYTVYLNSISSGDRYNVFNSSSDYWRAIRNEMIRNLSSEQYERIRAAFDPRYGSGGGGTSSGQTPGRPWNVNTFD